MGGRIHDVEVDPRDPATIYLGAAAGGIWKTTNKGTTWTPIFDGQPDNTFGDIAIFAGDSRIVWAGTGEQNNRQSSSWGGGVYRSTDAGATWSFVGLKESGSIGRVLLHPDRPERRLGRGGGQSLEADAGTRRLQDDRRRPQLDEGRSSWTRSRAPPRSSWTRATRTCSTPRRTSACASVFGFNGGGPGSALWKSHRRRRHLDEARERHPRRRQGAHRPRDRTVEARRAGRDDRALRRRRLLPLRGRRRHVDAREPHEPAPDVLQQARRSTRTTDQRIWLMGVQPVEERGRRHDLRRRCRTRRPTISGSRTTTTSLWIDPANTQPPAARR